MKNKILPFIFTIFFLVIFFIFYEGLKISKIYTPNIKVEKKVPIFTTNIFGSEKKINSKEIFKDNQFYLMNIWSSWCIPCKDEHPFLMNLANQEKIQIIGLNYKDNNKNAKNFLRDYKSPYKLILSDKDGTIAIEWGAYGVPETFLIYDKKIIKKFVGPLNKNSVTEINRIIE